MTVTGFHYFPTSWLNSKIVVKFIKKIAIIWDIADSSFVEKYQPFGGNSWLSSIL
jgi:hypothetical protein